MGGKRLPLYKMYLTWVSDDVIYTTDSTHHTFIHIRSDKLLNEKSVSSFNKALLFSLHIQDSNGWRPMHNSRVLSKYTTLLLFSSNVTYRINSDKTTCFEKKKKKKKKKSTCVDTTA